MFTNLRINIFIYYFVTLLVSIALSYYFFVISAVENLFILSVIVLCFIILSGVFISKLAVDPLQEYVQNLQNLSKETLHELNLPLSTIKINLGMIHKSISDKKTLKRLNRIESACEMLQERYNELDYFIKMQSRVDVNESFFLDVLVEDRVDFLSKIYPHITFHLTLENLEIFSDKTGLTKVIDNIVDNGVKYSKDSKDIDIQLKNNILFIRDYGIGMDEVELLEIFDNFYQSNSTMRGFGIGLGMVKRFCDKNSIELTFQSKKDFGTTVELKFKN